jgi:DNA polymerase III alpha subunit
MLHWPRSPSCITAELLDRPPEKARVTVAGLVLVRQRPGTAKGVIFVTLEDETGVVNVVIWARVYEAYRRQIIAGRLLRVTGRVQRDSQVVHVVAEHIEDISHMLDALALGAPLVNPAAPVDEAPRRAAPKPRAAQKSRARHPREQAKTLFHQV